jgi:hypothetical protein
MGMNSASERISPKKRKLSNRKFRKKIKTSPPNYVKDSKPDLKPANCPFELKNENLRELHLHTLYLPAPLSVTLARISQSFRREAQREPSSGSRSAETDSSIGAARQGAAGINEGTDFDGGLCEYTQQFAAIAATEKRNHSAQPEERKQSAVKIKPDAANVWLPHTAAGN